MKLEHLSNRFRKLGSAAVGLQSHRSDATLGLQANVPANTKHLQQRSIARRHGEMNGVARHLCYPLLMVFFLAFGVFADDQMLILTDEEFDANLDYRERDANIFKKPTDPMAPQIILETPDLGAVVAPPIDVSIRFQSSEDATIDLDSLRVRYGWFDITKRVRKSMTVTSDGIAGQLKSMRRGKYTLKVTISDSKRRKSSAKIRFTIDPNAQARNDSQ